MDNNNYSEAIKTIADMARKTQEAKELEINGRKYLVGCNANGEPFVKEILKTDNTAYPACMNVNTLDAFVNYIMAGLGNSEIKEELYINVISPTCVVAETPVNEYGRRKTIAKAERYNLRSFTFGQYNSFESFVVALQSLFISTEERGQLLNCLKTMTQSNEVHTEENGVSQMVVAKAGATLGSIQVSPIWQLCPFRTFTEIEQPASLFLLRLRQNGESAEFALHETDGGAWAVAAVTSIKEYLANRLHSMAGKVYIL